MIRQIHLVACIALWASALIAAIRALLDVSSPGPGVLGVATFLATLPVFFVSLAIGGLLRVRPALAIYQPLSEIARGLVRIASKGLLIGLTISALLGIGVAALGMATGSGHVQRNGHEYYSISAGVPMPISKHTYDLQQAASARFSAGIVLTFATVCLAIAVASRADESR